mmetsp:Transcript_11465/g.14950  ORF Transcript_11465/g.14950 Transcript_11465/m.14950 type:complete len:81 (+) Transcript_11465:5233-5475(+)
MKTVDENIFRDVFILFVFDFLKKKPSSVILKGKTILSVYSFSERKNNRKQLGFLRSFPEKEKKGSRRGVMRPGGARLLLR